MKRWHKAAILVVVTLILALAARAAMLLVFVWHYFFVAKCDGRSCQDYGAELYAGTFCTVGILFTLYFFFAFIWLFPTRKTAPDASGR